MIEIVAAVIQDEDGRVLLVRKRGTRAFMQPGGKRDPGEDDLAALARELSEELGCRLVAQSAVHLGTFQALAANEADQQVRAAVYHVRVDGLISPRAEIEELVWVDPDDRTGLVLAPLTRDHVLPNVHAIAAK
jgi:8-oxo-dGTP diphosphatase